VILIHINQKILIQKSYIKYMTNQIEQIISQLGNRSTEVMALGGLQKMILENFPSVEPYLAKIFPKLLEMAEHRENQKDVEQTGNSLIQSMSASTLASVLPAVMPALMAGVGEKAPASQQETALSFITNMVKNNPESMAAQASTLCGPLANMLNSKDSNVAEKAQGAINSLQGPGSPNLGALAAGAASYFFGGK